MAATPSPPLAGAVLCGGGSRRMGRDKSALVFDGESLLQRAVARLGVVADPVIVAGRTQEISGGCLMVADDPAGRGPLAGLLAALRVAPHQLCAVVAVDMPELSPVLLARLAALWRGEDAVVASDAENRRQPLHAVYSRSAIACCEEIVDSDDVSLDRLLSRLRVREVPAARLVDAQAAARFALNLNTPADVTAWRAAAARPPLAAPR